MTERVDAAIIGSGFAGSILAWVLVKRGLRVALIDSSTHPRFAIGESSTPIADILLRRLGHKYELNDFVSLSTWGSWQRSHPELACGRKRGFSYFTHTRGEPFREASLGERSLLVAASASDEVADTHWFRAEVDQFFFAGAVQCGAIDLSGHAVVDYQPPRPSGHAGPAHQVECLGEQRVTVVSDWLIDASGQAGVLARLTAAADLSNELQTQTHAVYAHFADVGSWTEHLGQLGIDTSTDPFDADDAAQHHLLDGGWLWMLRFNNRCTSVGYTAPLSHPLDWSGYPSIESMFHGAAVVGPDGGPRSSRRLQRLFDPLVGDRCLMLPTAATTIDPLHSTGIAHALAGVDRIATLITETVAGQRSTVAAAYARAVLDETRLLDRLVSTAYATMHDFSRFTVACMLYFAGAIGCEERYQRGETPARLFSGDDLAFRTLVDDVCRRLLDPSTCEFEDEIRERLRPWNTAGLMDPAVANRYAYTATK